MSGDAGVCPIGPAANPANPAPSVTRPSKFDIGTSFADGFAFMSTNWAKKNSIPSFSARFLIASAAGLAMVVAIGWTPCRGFGPQTLPRTRPDFHWIWVIPPMPGGRRLCFENKKTVLDACGMGRGGEGDRVAPRPSGTEEADDRVR